jgi:hypothetical protein
MTSPVPCVEGAGAGTRWSAATHAWPTADDRFEYVADAPVVGAPGARAYRADAVPGRINGADAGSVTRAGNVGSCAPLSGQALAYLLEMGEPSQSTSATRHAPPLLQHTAL